jgi:2-haloacid dehalogenase
VKRSLRGIKALAFDVFGTVVDWRGSLIAEGRRLGRRKRVRADWAAFADAWRAGYRPAMDRVRRGELGWTKIDDLHRMILDDLIPRFGLTALTEAERVDLNRVWHRLTPWRDSLGGLKRLKRRYVLVTMSNGNVALLVNMAKRAGLPWDAVLSAEIAGHYKPDPQAYLSVPRLLGVDPGEVLMVAAHKDDLDGAARARLRTAFVARPLEFGDPALKDVAPEPRFDVNAKDFLDLARQLGC